MSLDSTYMAVIVTESGRRKYHYPGDAFVEAQRLASFGVKFDLVLYRLRPEEVSFKGVAMWQNRFNVPRT